MTDIDFFGTEHPLWKNSEDVFEEKVLPKIKPSQVTDPEEYVRLFLQDDQNQKFVYMRRANRDPDPTHYNPYDLVIIPYSEVNLDDYYTLSAKGVSHFLHGIPDFTQLSQWMREKKIFGKIMELDLFNLFKLNKTYTAWKNYVHYKKMDKSQNTLQKELFCLTGTLRNSMAQISNICYEVREMGFMSFDKYRTYTRQEFEDLQRENITAFKGSLDTIRQNILNIMEAACEKMLCDFESLFEESVKHGTPKSQNGSRKESKKASRSGGSYTEQAERRSLYRKLRNFIKLCDFFIAETLHDCIKGSISKFYEDIKELLLNDDKEGSVQMESKSLGNTKEEDFAEVYNDRFGKEDDIDTQEIMLNAEAAVLKDNEEVRSPMFTIDLRFINNEMRFLPNFEDVLGTIDSAISNGMDCVFEIGSCSTYKGFSSILSFDETGRKTK